ncbi:MAG: serine hydroxymethyltransferase, partial [Thiotrichales bacterium 32-46-8]
PAVTSRGFTEGECTELAGWMCDVLDSIGKDNEAQVQATTIAKVAALCARFPVYAN